MKTLSIRDGDIHLDPKGNLASASDLEALRQVITEHLLTIRGEWALDLTIGIPYMDEVFRVGVTEGELRQIFDSKIREFSEVIGMTNSASIIDSRLRTYKYAAIVETIYGKTEIVLDG